MKAVAALAVVLAGCTAATAPPSPYRASVSDSAVYQAKNVEPLRPLEPMPDGWLLVTNLRYQPLPTGWTTLTRDTWVTGVPEVQSRCRTFTGDAAPRLRQLLGLPPDHGGQYFVTFCVKAADVFRPAVDPRIDTVLPCELYSPDDCGNVFPASATAEHRAWIAGALLGIHLWPGGYPYTHLGYTYDWGNGGAYGASEYIVRGGSEIEVLDAQRYDDYCGRQR